MIQRIGDRAELFQEAVAARVSSKGSSENSTDDSPRTGDASSLIQHSGNAAIPSRLVLCHDLDCISEPYN